MPRTAVPVVGAREVEVALSRDVEHDVAIGRLFPQEVARVGAFVPAGSIVGAPHVRPSTDLDPGKVGPVAVGVRADGDYGHVSRSLARVETFAVAHLPVGGAGRDDHRR